MSSCLSVGMHVFWGFGCNSKTDTYSPPSFPSSVDTPYCKKQKRRTVFTGKVVKGREGQRKK